MRATYTISEMAELLGVTTHMLRYYEKTGIIQPYTDPGSGYRHYAVTDTRRFNLCRMLRAADFSLEDCKALLDWDDPAANDEVFARQIAQLRRKQVLAGLAADYLTMLREEYSDITQRVGRMAVTRRQEAWRLTFSANESPTPDPVLEAEKEEWLACLPAVNWVSRIPHATLVHYGQGAVRYDYGLMLPAAQARALGLRRTANVEVIAGGDFVSTIWRQAGRGPFDWDSLTAPLAWLRAQGITHFGDGYSYILASRRGADGETENYHYLGIKLLG